MTSTSERERAADWRRSQASIRLLIAIRRAERQTVATAQGEETAQSPRTSMASKNIPRRRHEPTPRGSRPGLLRGCDLTLR
jgi:hypothetical protein